MRRYSLLAAVIVTLSTLAVAPSKAEAGMTPVSDLASSSCLSARPLLV
jgi:hypothetical protein